MYRHPNHHYMRSEEQMEEPAEGESGRQAKSKKVTRKRTTEKAGEVHTEDGRGEHKWKRGSQDTRDGGGGGSKQPVIVEGEKEWRVGFVNSQGWKSKEVEVARTNYSKSRSLMSGVAETLLRNEWEVEWRDLCDLK